MKRTSWQSRILRARLGRGVACGFAVLALQGSSLPAAEPAPGAAPFQGPGLPHTGFAPEQLFKQIGRIDERLLGVKGPHGLAHMHRGWLTIVVGGKGFGFVDVSDPSSPKLVHFERHEQVAEGRAYGFSHGRDGDTLALMATDGLMIWNVTDVRRPALLGHLEFPQ